MNLKKIITIFTIILTFSSFAGLKQAPPSFVQSGQKAVWIDFISASYKLTFDVEKSEALSVSTIIFKVEEEGFPIFDVTGEIRELKIDGKTYSQREVLTPGKESKVRIIEKSLTPGEYTLELTTVISHGVKFKQNSVSAGFFMKDMRDRQFLERFLPSNYEYDQYEMRLSVKVIGTGREHRLFTNGEELLNISNEFEFIYPKYFTSSSLYFHLVPNSKFKVLNFNYKSISGQSIPVTIYSKSKMLNYQFKRRTKSILSELEKDYGPWPHPGLILYANGNFRGGMEYAGAAVSGWFALGHELQHGYFARAVMPANGNAGWIDEAVASWRDYFHMKSRKPNYETMNLGNHSLYSRKTDIRSYKSGRSFMAYMQYLLKKEGKCLKDFLKEYFTNRKFTTITTENFRQDLENYYGKSLESIFKRYIYGNQVHKSSLQQENPYHPVLSDEELAALI